MHAAFLANLKVTCLLLLPIAAGCTVWRDVTDAVDNARVNVRVGFVGNPAVAGAGSSAVLAKAAAWFRYRKADAMVVLGELTADGDAAQFARLMEVLPTNDTRVVTLPAPEERKLLSKTDDATLAGTCAADGQVIAVGGFRFRIQYGRFAAKPEAGDVLTFWSEGNVPLTDDLSFFRFGCFNVGSLSGVALPAGYAVATDAKKGAPSANAVLVSVYDDRIVVERLDLAPDKPLDEREAFNLRGTGIPYAETVASPIVLDPSNRTEVVAKDAPPDVPPEFWADAHPIVMRGATRKGDPVVTVRFPPVLARFTGRRAFAYEVTCGSAKRLVLSPSFHRAECRESEALVCTFQGPEFADAAAVTVTPIGPRGTRGRTIREAGSPVRRESLR